MDQDIIGRILGLGLQKISFVVIESGKLNSLGGGRKRTTQATPIATHSGNRLSLRRRIENTIVYMRPVKLLNLNP